MKLKVFRALIPLAFVLIACNKQENTEKFVGFTPVGADKENAKLYIDLNTVRRLNNGLVMVSFNMIRVLPNGYAIQDAETDCVNNFKSLEGVKFRDDGTSEEKFIAETFILPNKDNLEINTLVAIACDKAGDNRIITGAFDNIKALEMLYGTYQTGNQTALWNKIEPPNTLEGYEAFIGKSGAVKILDSKDFIQQDKTKHILLTSTSVGDSPKVLLNAAVFVKIDDKWHVEAEYPYLKVAKNGVPKIMQWERFGKDNYGVIEANVYTTSEELDLYTGYLFLYELNAGGLNNLIEYSDKNVLDFSHFIGKTDNINITFDESKKTYWDATITIKRAAGQTEEVYQFQNGKYVPLWINTLKELFGVTDPSGKVKSAPNELSKVWFEQSFKDGNDNAHVVFIRTEPNEMSSDWAVYAGAVTYNQVDGEWRIVSKQPKIGEVTDGCWSVYEQVSMLKLTPNKIAFLINNSGCPGMGGRSTDQRNVYVYANNHWQDLGGDIYIYGDYAPLGCYNQGEPHKTGAYQCWSYGGKISVITSKKEYPDLLVTKTGTEEDGKGNVISAKNYTYVFNGKKYEKKP